jgi:UDP-GlcNAc3NAcA epimerase
LNRIFSALNKISKQHKLKILLPLHPRTKKMAAQLLKPELQKEIEANKNYIVCEPVSFLEMIALEKNCRMVMTDSGGVQKEAFYFKKPCVVLRTETEWVELAECGAAIVAGVSDEHRIIDSFEKLYNNPPKNFPAYYGDGHAAEFICGEIVRVLKV